MATAKKKPKGRAASANGVSEAMLAKLEKQYDQVAGMLHVSNAADDKIRQHAIRKHDQVNTELARLGAKLRSELPEPDKADAERYGQLLIERSHLQGVIHKARRPITEQGVKPPL